VINVGSGPDGVVVLPDNTEAYVANNNTNNVSVISTVDNSVLATVPVGGVAADVVATPDSKTVWVSNYGDGTVQAIDTATRTAGPPIHVGGNPQRLRISPTAPSCGYLTRAPARSASSTWQPAPSPTRSPLAGAVRRRVRAGARLCRTPATARCR